jgi:succinyl-diaminopimelate desuccinylase
VLGDRLAARTLELIDIPSESRHEAALAGHIASLLDLTDLGDTCLIARRGAPVLLAGHLDTVPAQDNLPGRLDGERVHGLGASDMKGALAVMIELGRAGAPFDLLFFGREELPARHSALAPLLARERLDYALVVMMEPTANELHAGCVGNVNATWTFHGRSGHSARPWDADNAIHAAARGIAALAAVEREEHVFDGLTFYEVASVTQIRGGIAQNVIPDRVDAHVNYRFAPGRSPDEARARLRELCPGGELVIDSLAPSGPSRRGRRWPSSPRRGWTP